MSTTLTKPCSRWRFLLTVALSSAIVAGCQANAEFPPTPSDTAAQAVASNEELVEFSFNGIHASVIVPQGFVLDPEAVERFESLSLGEEEGYQVGAWVGKNANGDVIILTITDSRDNVLYNRDTGVVEFSVPFSGEDVLRDDPKFQVPGSLASRLVVGRLEVDGTERTVSQLVAIVRDDKESAAWVMLGVNEVFRGESATDDLGEEVATSLVVEEVR